MASLAQSPSERRAASVAGLETRYRVQSGSQIARFVRIALIEVCFDMAYEQLKLENQICFPIYAASRLITREYQPLLDELGLTYPQYLTLLVLWERDGLPVNEIGQKLLLNTNTVTPLLKRMEAQGLVTRRRSPDDERRVIVTLTSQGRALQEQAVAIPAKLVAGLDADDVDEQALHDMLSQLQKIIQHLSEKQSGLIE